MLDLGVLFITAVLYFTGRYNWAFWLVAGITLNSVLGLVKALLDPDWYQRKRLEGGLEWNGGRMGALIATKAISIPLEALLAWWLGSLAGYF